MGKFEKEAKVLLDAIGGKENVSAVTHCATRMRFVLIDEKKADVKAIEEIGSCQRDLYECRAIPGYYWKWCANIL